MTKQIVDGPHVVEWVSKRVDQCDNFGAAVGIGLEKDGQLIAGCVFTDWNGVNVNFHVASDGSRSWLNRKFLWFCCNYAFNTAGCNRVTAIIRDDNEASLRIAEHIGFQHEARLKGAHPAGDVCIYTMWKRDCKYLTLGKKRDTNE